MFHGSPQLLTLHSYELGFEAYKMAKFFEILL